MKKFFSLVICILSIAFLLMAPAFIAGGIHKNVYTMRAEKLANQYTGSLEIWHIVSFKTGGESGVSNLKSRAAEFEKNNPYVFITVVGMTPEEAEQRLAAGERPDIFSFPLGFPLEHLLSRLEEPEEALLPTLAETGKKGDHFLAYPYMMGFYTITVNQEIYFSSGASLPIGAGLPRANFNYLIYHAEQNWKEEDAEILSLCNTYGLAPLKTLEYFREEGENNFLIGGPPADYAPDPASFSTDGTDHFLKGKAALLLAPAADYEKLLLDQRANSLSLTTLTFSDYTDLVQLVGVCQTQDSAKQAMCQNFAASLLRRKAQKGLENLKMLPAVQLESVYEGQTLYLEEYERLATSAIIPKAFE